MSLPPRPPEPSVESRSERSVVKLQPAIELPLPASLLAEDSLRPGPSRTRFCCCSTSVRGGLRRYVGSFGLGAQATEDVLQDVFLSLFRHLRLGRSRSNLKGWLFQVGPQSRAEATTEDG